MAGLIERAKANVLSRAQLLIPRGYHEKIKAPYFTFDVECRDCNGNLKWRARAINTVATLGKNRLIDTTFRAVAAGTWYVGLKGAGTAAAADTAASHAAWSELTGYAEGTRQALTLAAASAGSANNSASKAVFTMNATATIVGNMIIDNSTKGGTTGTLYSAGDFTGGSRGVQSGDVLSVTCTLTIA